MLKKSCVRWGVGLLASVVAAGCQVSKSSNPLSPAVAGPIAGVEISKPNLLEPGPGWQIQPRDQPLTLMFQSANTSGVRSLYYTIEIATDAAFSSVIFARTGVEAPGPGVVTTMQLPDALPTGLTYWWRARAEDGANVGEYSTPVSFTALAPVVLGAPTAVDPSGTITTLTPAFRVAAGGKSGPHEGIVYYLQVANDPAFGSTAALFVADESGSATTIDRGYSFLNNRTYYWRVQSRDTGDSGATSAWSAVRTFTTQLPVSTPLPSGGGLPPPADSAQCGPPFKTAPLAILECHRSFYPQHMSAGQHVAFLKASARDLTRAAVSGGPFGVLRKEGGNNCHGYSCDIICAGQGGGQRQWDVLIDETYATWGSPLGTIRVDLCEIQ